MSPVSVAHGPFAGDLPAFHGTPPPLGLVPTPPPPLAPRATRGPGPQVQNTAAKLWFNPNVEIDGRVYKYGVLSTTDLLLDLTDWRYMYVSGRMQKPVQVRRPVEWAHVTQGPPPPKQAAFFGAFLLLLLRLLRALFPDGRRYLGNRWRSSVTSQTTCIFHLVFAPSADRQQPSAKRQPRASVRRGARAARTLGVCSVDRSRGHCVPLEAQERRPVGSPRTFVICT